MRGELQIVDFVHNFGYTLPRYRSLYGGVGEVWAGTSQTRRRASDGQETIGPVVDDEDSLRTVLSNELINEGYEVRTAPDGDDAIQEMGKASYDLVLLDIKMPRMNGFEVLKHIKEQHEKTKVVMLTGFADLKNAIESKKLGADDLSKAIRLGGSAHDD
jgi:CheY-like chemotaxis protein